MTDPDIEGFRFLAHVEFDGAGDCMQIIQNGDHIYVGHMGYTGVGTSIIDVRNPRQPRVVHQLPIPANTHSHKVQIAHDIMMVNHEQQLRAGEPYSAGLKLYDISAPDSPVEIGWLPIDGEGVHRMWWVGDELTYFSVRERGYDGRFLMAADVSRPDQPVPVARWWYPGQWTAGGEVPTWGPERRMRAHHVIVAGDRAYGGWGDAGFMIFDVSNREISLVSQREWASEVGGNTNTHTGLPLLSHGVVAVTDESLKDNCQEPPKRARLFDIADEKEPKLIGLFPEPEGDFCAKGGRFGSHNFHENRPGSFVSDDIVFLTYFNAGLRAYDLRVHDDIREIARFVPSAPKGQPAIQLNDVFVAENGIVYVSDRLAGGVYVLEFLDGRA
ncbi:MAG: LVIVD repeat-containing protein [Acidimicrobiales bacterium]